MVLETQRQRIGFHPFSAFAFASPLINAMLKFDTNIDVDANVNA